MSRARVRGQGSGAPFPLPMLNVRCGGFGALRAQQSGGLMMVVGGAAGEVQLWAGRAFDEPSSLGVTSVF